ncbi:hypothetical protein PMAYCL1PPCAC_13502, partial [Pristionchus mayeri]
SECFLQIFSCVLVICGCEHDAITFHRLKIRMQNANIFEHQHVRIDENDLFDVIRENIVYYVFHLPV